MDEVRRRMVATTQSLKSKIKEINLTKSSWKISTQQVIETINLPREGNRRLNLIRKSESSRFWESEKMRMRIKFFSSFTTITKILYFIPSMLRYVPFKKLQTLPFDFVMGSLLFSPSFLRGLPLFRVMAASFFLVVLQISMGIFSST